MASYKETCSKIRGHSLTVSGVVRGRVVRIVLVVLADGGVDARDVLLNLQNGKFDFQGVYFQILCDRVAISPHQILHHDVGELMKIATG